MGTHLLGIRSPALGVKPTPPVWRPKPRWRPEMVKSSLGLGTGQVGFGRLFDIVSFTTCEEAGVVVGVWRVHLLGFGLQCWLRAFFDLKTLAFSQCLEKAFGPDSIDFT